MMFAGCLALFFFAAVAAATPQAALYVDNGRGQTAIDRLMTSEEKLEMEVEILHLLGLEHRPRKINKSTVKRSAPRFLLDIYEKLREEEMDETGRKKRSSSYLNLSGAEQQQIDQSDVIMTFESVSHQVASVRHERGKRLWFNVSEIPVAEDIVGAELRIYQNDTLNTKRIGEEYTISAYQLVNTDDGERELEYISSVNTTAGAQGWLGLNLTQSLAIWAAFPESNKGMYLSVHPKNRPGQEVRPEDIGLVTVKSLEETQPFMVAFLKATNHIKSRSTRETKARVKKSSIPPAVRGGKHSYYEFKDQSPSKMCQIHALRITFKDLKWQDWIIAPEGYAAYYCSGECNFPLNAHMNASNHAIVQTLVHLMQPLRFPKPCCSPTRMAPISVLYFLDDKNVVLKKYKKMVVKTCGCR